MHIITIIIRISSSIQKHPEEVVTVRWRDPRKQRTCSFSIIIKFSDQRQRRFEVSQFVHLGSLMTKGGHCTKTYSVRFSLSSALLVRLSTVFQTNIIWKRRNPNWKIYHSSYVACIRLLVHTEGGRKEVIRDGNGLAKKIPGENKTRQDS